MEKTPNLNLPYMLPGQAQKHVTFNQALLVLDAEVQTGVQSRSISAPPAEPAEGATYIIAPGASGMWSAHEGKIAAWQDGAWAFYTPREGQLVFVADETALLVWLSGGWTTLFLFSTGALDRIGIGATADATNRLAVASQAVLFSHDGDDQQVKINKATSGDTASLLFQAGFVGHAEFGLAGDNDFRIKVSADGADWHEALRIDRQTGAVWLPNSPRRELLDASRTYFVRTDGNDSNDGLSDTPPGAFATVQRAVDAAAALDLATFAVTIQVGPGTYTDPVELKPYIGAGPISIVGSPAAPGQVVLHTTGDCIRADGAISRYVLNGLRLKCPGTCLYANGGALCEFTNIEFDGSGTHIYARAGAAIQATDSGAYAITSASFARHAYANLPGASVAAYGNTVTLPAAGASIASEFTQAKRATAINLGGCTFVNGASATGKKYVVQENAILITGGAAPSLPGDADGDVLTGGIVT